MRLRAPNPSGGYFLITGIAAFFVLRVFVVEIRPSVREVMEDVMVDSANLLAEVAALPNLPYKPETDLLPLVPATSTPHILIVAPGFPAKNVEELVGRARAEPERLVILYCQLDELQRPPVFFFKSVKRVCEGAYLYSARVVMLRVVKV